MSSAKARADSLSLLLFTLRSGKLMAINLLKVSEIIPCPPLTKLPESHPHVKGIATLRGASLSVIDLSPRHRRAPLEDPDGGCLIVTDVSRSKQGLHVQAVSKIVHCLTYRHPPAALRLGGEVVHHRGNPGRRHAGAGAGHRKSHSRHRPARRSNRRRSS